MMVLDIKYCLGFVVTFLGAVISLVCCEVHFFLDMIIPKVADFFLYVGFVDVVSNSCLFGQTVIV